VNSEQEQKFKKVEKRIKRENVQDSTSQQKFDLEKPVFTRNS